MLTLPNKKIYLISDTHFYHTNIIKYCNRPFSDYNEMNKTLFENWNNTVTNDDIVLFLGDFVVGSSQYGVSKKEACEMIYKNLNGEKYFILGNHDDKRSSIFLPELVETFEYRGKSFTLSHHPLDLYVTDYLIHGHIHNSPDPVRDNRRAFNVSVEDINYTPILLDEIIERLS